MIPLALCGAVASLASFQTDPVSAAEGLLLGSLGAAVLLCAAALEGPGRSHPSLYETSEGGSPPWSVSVGAVLAALLLWAVPSGGARGTGLSALLLFLLLAAAARRLATTPDRLPLAAAIPPCLGLQFLLRPQLFLELSPAPEEVLSLWVPPLGLALVAALALNLLARRHGARNALLAGGAVLVLSSGWTFVGAGSLLALAAGELAAGPRNPPPVAAATGPMSRRRVRGWGYWTPATLLTGGLLAGWLAGIPRRGLAFLALLALASALAAGWKRMRLPPAGSGSAPYRRLPVLGVLGLGVVAVGLELTAAIPARDEAAALALLALALALLPQALLVPRLRGLAGLLLAFLGARWLPGAGPAEAALAGAAAFAALELPARRKGAPAQDLWLGGWVLLGTLAGAYPWLRRSGFEALAGALSGTPGGGGAILWLAGTLLVAATAWAQASLQKARGTTARPGLNPILAAAVGFALLVGSLLAIGPAGEPVLASQSVTLTEEHPRWHLDTLPFPASRLVVVSNLAFALDLPAGQPVAVLRLRHPDGTTSIGHLEAAVHTAEWSVRRPGSVGHPDLVRPSPWQVVAAPDGPYFAQRYRSVHHFETREPVVAVDIFRRRNLPREVSLTLFRVELLP